MICAQGTCLAACSCLALHHSRQLAHVPGRLRICCSWIRNQDSRAKGTFCTLARDRDSLPPELRKGPSDTWHQSLLVGSSPRSTPLSFVHGHSMAMLVCASASLCYVRLNPMKLIPATVQQLALGPTSTACASVCGILVDCRCHAFHSNRCRCWRDSVVCCDGFGAAWFCESAKEAAWFFGTQVFLIIHMLRRCKAI